MQRGILPHQLLHRIKRIEAARPEILVVPSVFANGDRKPEAIELNDLLRGRRGEISLLVEDVVKRKQTLVLFKKDAATVKKYRCIHRRLSGVR